MNAKLIALRNSVLYRNRVSSGGLFTIKKINATFRVKAVGLLLAMFKQMLPAIGLEITKARVRAILCFIHSCKGVHRAQGMKGLVIWLKANTVILQQALGGFVLKNMTPLGCRVSRTQSGLPRLILAMDRTKIRNGDTNMIRFYLTLCNLYRVLEFPGKLKIKTITQGSTANISMQDIAAKVNGFIPVFSNMILERSGGLLLKTRGIETSSIFKSSPTSHKKEVSSTPWSLAISARRLRDLGLAPSIEFFIEFYKDGSNFRYPGLVRIFQDAANFFNLPLWENKFPNLDRYPVGKLGLKEEAAGKVRVFAMVDSWTQWCLKPLHDELFRILDTLPMDGTHDQLKPLGRHTEWGSLDSLDLSAATDRLPAILQRELLASLIDPLFAHHWYKLLVDREYLLRCKTPDGMMHNELLRYAVGQPMGALSSWAMLAYTHHFIVQCAAWLSGVTPVGSLFRDYAVLGDDLVIGNKRVRVWYLLIVEAIGVECGLAKSILSPKALAIEFAKRTFYKGVDVSPIPVLEFVMATLTLSEAVSFAKKYSLSFAQLLKSLGYGYRVLGSLSSHVSQLNSRVRALLFASSMPQTDEDAVELLSKGNPHLSSSQLGEILILMRDNAVKMVDGRIKSIQNKTIRSADAASAYVATLWASLQERYGSSFPKLRSREFFYDFQDLFTDLSLLTLNQDTEDRGKALAKVRRTNSLRWTRSAIEIYSNLVSTLRDLNLYLPSNTSFEREEVIIRKGRMDPTQIRLWKMFTAAILVALKEKR